MGIPGTGAAVFHPRHGHGTVTGHTGSHVTVSFSGGEQSFEAFHGAGKGRLEQRRAGDPEARLRGIYGDRLETDGSDIARRHAADLDRVFTPEMHQLLARNGVRVSLGSGPVTQYAPDLRGVRPRGWPEGKTWDDVPAMARGDRQLILGDVPGTSGLREYSMAGHEMSHVLSRVMGGERPVSDSTEFARFHAGISDSFEVAPYFRQPGGAGRDETFAEAFGVWNEVRDKSPAARQQAMVDALTAGFWSNTPVTLPGVADLDALFTRLSAGARRLATSPT